MNKKLVKILSVLMIAVMVVSIVTPVFAAIDIPEDGDTEAVSGVSDLGSKILGAVQIVAGFAAVILLIVLAIKYMVASPEGKADIKKTALIYVVGACLMFGTSAILGAIQTFMNGGE